MTVIDVLAEAHKLLRKAVPGLRRAAHRTEGKLAAAFRDAMDIVDQQKAAGVSQAERLQGLDAVLRDAWPQTREWKYLCESCQDTGLVMAVCRAGHRCNGVSTRLDSPGSAPGRYRRLCAQEPNSTYAHEYGRPCFCSNGLRFTSAPKPAPEDFRQAGRSKPTRVGR